MSEDISWDAPSAGSGEDVSWDAPTSPQATSVGADVAKSAGIGLAKGAIDFAGMPGDAANLLTKGVDAATNMIANTFGLDERAKSGPPILPTSGQIQSGVEDLTGKFYQPQTRAGRFAGTMGEFMGNPSTYFGPGGLLRNAAMGAAAGAGSEGAGQLVEAGGDKFKTLEPYARLAGGLGAGAIAGRMGRADYKPAPTVDDLKDSATGHYNAMHSMGVEVHPYILDDTATNITTALKTQGFYPNIAPKTYSMIDELRNPDGPTFTTQQIESIRRGLNKVGPDPTDRLAARQAIDAIDNTMAGLTPADAAVNGHFAPRVAQEAAMARGDYAAAKQAELIEAATTKAERQAASTGSGANIDNATRQKFNQLLNNPSKMRGIPDDVRTQMEQVVNGTFTGDASRLVGKLAATGIVSAGMGAAIGHYLGLPPGVVPAVGYGLKKIGDTMTTAGARKSSELRRLNSPLARQRGSVPTPPGYSRAAGLIAPAFSNATNYPNPYEANP